MLDASFLKQAEIMARDCVVKSDSGIEYVPDGYKPVATPRVAPIAIHSLMGLVDYLKENVDNHELGTLMVHIEGPTRIKVVSRPDKVHRDRETFLDVEMIETEFPFGDYLSHSDFMIGLASKFTQADPPDCDKAYLMEVMAHVSVETSIGSTDDGMSQEVEVKSRFQVAREVAIKPRVELRPFRTFREVEQPKGTFVPRLERRGNAFVIGLFEADGGAWKIEAVRAVRAWLSTAFEDAKLQVAILS